MEKYQVEISTGRSNRPYGKIQYFDYETRKEANLYLCSRFDPEAEGEKWAEALYNNDIELFFVYGLGFGYHIKALTKRLKTHQSLYVLEVNRAIQNQLIPYSALTEKEMASIHLLCTDSLNAASQFIGNFLNKVREGNYRISLYHVSMQLMPEEFRQLRDVLEDYQIAINSSEKFNEEIARNIEMNQMEDGKNVATFFGTLMNKPIIIVSGGPSLDRNVDLLKTLGNEVFIFSTGRTFKMLLQKGIRVDMFCIIDAQELTYSQIQGVEDAQVPFVFLNTANHKTVSRYKGPKYMAYNKEASIEQEGRVESGGSVATAMLDMAIKFGGNPIIFIGQDLAHTNELSHCDNTAGRIRVKDDVNILKVRGINSEYLPTTRALLSYKHWIEKKIAKHPELTFYNCTEGGAYIEGCEHRLLRDILNQIE
jgi:hypothetical protein